jgi:hypothetical protein
VLEMLSGISFVSKFLISLVIIALPAFFMGMPFPVGLKLCSQNDESTIPWAWGINGCVSVISASLASLLAVELGFNAVILIASLSYGICLLSVYVYKLF